VALLYAKGDLFEASEPVFAHGCNCAGAMGRGIAKQFRRRWPEMYVEYKRRCTQNKFGLGDIFVWQRNDVIIYNLGTQATWRTIASLDAIATSVRQMIDHSELYNIRRITMPLVGAGHGGLRWESIEEAIREILSSTFVEVVIIRDFIKNHPLELL